MSFDALSYAMGKAAGGGGGGGGSGGVLVCTADFQTMALNHTWQEIKDAAIAVLDGGNMIAFATNFTIDVNYYVYFASFTTDASHPVEFVTATATSANDYPVIQIGP